MHQKYQQWLVAGCKMIWHNTCRIHTSAAFTQRNPGTATKKPARTNKYRFHSSCRYSVFSLNQYLYPEDDECSFWFGVFSPFLLVTFWAFFLIFIFCQLGLLLYSLWCHCLVATGWEGIIWWPFTPSIVAVRFGMWWHFILLGVFGPECAGWFY